MKVDSLFFYPFVFYRHFPIQWCCCLSILVVNSPARQRVNFSASALGIDKGHFHRQQRCSHPIFHINPGKCSKAFFEMNGEPTISNGTNASGIVDTKHGHLVSFGSMLIGRIFGCFDFHINRISDSVCITTGQCYQYQQTQAERRPMKGVRRRFHCCVRTKRVGH